MNKLFVIISIILLVSCNEAGKQPAASPATTDTVTKKDGTQVSHPEDTMDTGFRRFGIYYEQMINALLRNDAATFNSFIHPQYGLCIIESNGAMPQIRNGRDISRFKTIQGRSLFELDKESLRCELKEEALPAVDCDKEGFYTKEGCFTQEINGINESRIWEYANLKEEEKDLAAKAAGSVTRTVINTKAYRFYFSKIGNQWYLTFLDLRIPCNA